MTARRRSTSDESRPRFGVYLDLDTRKALLKAAIDEGISASELVRRLIQTYLQSLEAKKGRRSQ